MIMIIGVIMIMIIIIIIFAMIIVMIMIIMTIHIIKMETIFMNTENSKTNESHRFKLDLADKLNLKNPKKNMALANLSIYYTWKNIKSEYNNNKFKISDPTWIYLMVLILFQIFKIILNLSSKNMDIN